MATETAPTLIGRIFCCGNAFAVVEVDWPPLDVGADPTWPLDDQMALHVAAGVHAMDRVGLRPPTDSPSGL